MSHERKKRCGNSAGKVLIELLLIAPLLLMIPAGVMEYARYLRMDQIAAVYSQETANRAYRQCGDFYVNVAEDANTWSSEFSPTKTSEETLRCITNVSTSTNSSMQRYIPGSQIIISVYRYNFDVTLTPPTDTLTLVAAIPPQTPLPGMYSRTLIGIDGNGTALIRMPPRSGEVLSAAEVRSRQRIIVAEVVFTYRPVISLFRAFLNAASLTTNGEFRETTIL